MTENKSNPLDKGNTDDDDVKDLIKDLKIIQDQVRQGFKAKTKIKKNDAHLIKKATMISRGILKIDPVENVYHQAELPRGLSLNLTGHCNYNCTYCAIVLKPNPPEYIDEKVFKKAFDEIGNHPLYVQLGARGEALLHPKAFDFFKYIKEKNKQTYICLNTNGSMCNKKITEKLLMSEVDQIIFSLQTVNEEIYERIEDNKHFQKVMANIRYLSKRRKEINSNMVISAQFLDTEENLPHRDAFEAFCEECGIDMQVNNVHEWGDKFETKLDADANRYPCPYLWLYPTLTHNGNLGPCYADWYEEMVFGSVEDKTVHDVWTGERAQQIRELHLNSQWDELPLCKNCSGWSVMPNPFVKKGNTFTLPLIEENESDAHSQTAHVS